MKKIILASAICGALICSGFGSFIMSSWKISEDYVISFSGKGAEGNFGSLAGEVEFDPDRFTAGVMNVSVDVNTIDTGNETKNKHARGAKWFDAEQFPQINLRANQFAKTDQGYLLTGKLTMRGVTKEISFPFTFEPQADSGIFEGEFMVNRQDYGIKGPFLSFMVADEFKVKLKVPVKAN